MQTNDLTFKQQRFCEEYFIDGNAKAAFERAGYTGDNARSRAAELMRKPAVAEYLSILQAESRIRNRIDGDALIGSMMNIATGEAQREEYEYQAIRQPSKDNPVPDPVWRFSEEARNYLFDTGALVTAGGRFYRRIPKAAKAPSFGERLKAFELLARLTGAFTTANLAAKEEFKLRLAAEATAIEAELNEVPTIVPVDGEE